jgi:hypothetical protein
MSWPYWLYSGIVGGVVGCTLAWVLVIGIPSILSKRKKRPGRGR